MKYTILVCWLLALLFISGCSSKRHLDGLSQEAEAAYVSGDHAEALLAYERLISALQERGQDVDGMYYLRAGLLAFEAGATGKTIEYLELARHQSVADAPAYVALAKAYREIDNLSREITMLEHYVQKYPDGDTFKEVQQRLFKTLVKSLNFQQAYKLWPELKDDFPGNEVLMTNYLLVLRAMDQDSAATELAGDILDINRSNEEALEWLAKRHFRHAEEKYQKEMQAYEQNRTHRQYAQLLKAMDIINTDLHIALDYFKRLYAKNPTGEYASYLANIYERFQDEENARYYRRRAR